MSSLLLSSTGKSPASSAGKGAQTSKDPIWQGGGRSSKPGAIAGPEIGKNTSASASSGSSAASAPVTAAASGDALSGSGTGASASAATATVEEDAQDEADIDTDHDFGHSHLLGNPTVGGAIGAPMMPYGPSMMMGVGPMDVGHTPMGMPPQMMQIPMHPGLISLPFLPPQPNQGPGQPQVSLIASRHQSQQQSKSKQHLNKALAKQQLLQAVKAVAPDVVTKTTTGNAAAPLTTATSPAAAFMKRMVPSHLLRSKKAAAPPVPAKE